MAVEPGESQVTAPAPQLVDAAALSEQLVNGVFARLDAQNAPAPAATRQERVSAFEAKAAELLKSEQIDKDVMPVMLDLIKAMGADLSAKQREEAMAQAAQSNTKAIHDELGRMVDRYGASSSNPELIRELKEKIAGRVIDEYNSNRTLTEKYKRDGSVDWTEMDKLVVKHVTKWGATKEGTEAAKPAGGIAMKNAAPSGSIETTKTFDKDSMNDNQLDFFNSQVSFGTKQMGLSKADAEKRALDRVSKAESQKAASKR